MYLRIAARVRHGFTSRDGLGSPTETRIVYDLGPDKNKCFTEALKSGEGTQMEDIDLFRRLFVG